MFPCDDVMNTKRTKSEAKSYSIDELQPEIVDAILVRLPIRDAVRTSILSPQWRYKWATMTQLEFIEDGCVKGIDHAQLIPSAEFSNIINQVLMGHVGPIHKFKVTANLINPSKVDQWMIFLWRNGIKELELNFYGENYYSVHSCLFSCLGITILDLYGCELKLPLAFKGFTQLSVLKLQNTRLSEFGLEILILNCPVLQNLELIDIEGCHCFKISSTSLKCLFFRGEFTDFSLVRTPVLSELSIDLEEPVEFIQMRAGEISKISNILACANSIEKLQLLGYCSAFVATGSKQERLPVVFEHLTSLCLCISFVQLEEIWFLLSVLRSCFYLRELTLRGCSYDLVPIEDKIWEIDADAFDFYQLRVVELINFHCIQPEMQFIKLLLDRAPVLLKMKISIDLECDTLRELILKELLQFRRASRQAQIICLK